MTRILDMDTLHLAAKDFAALFPLPTVYSKSDPFAPINGRDWVINNLYDALFMDEHDIIVELMHDQLGKAVKPGFDKLAKERFKPRSKKVFADELAEHLAITPDGDHIEGRIGRINLGSQIVDIEPVIAMTAKGPRPTWRNVAWAIYAGEREERERKDGGAADRIPESKYLGKSSVGALAAGASNVAAIAALDALTVLLDGGTAAGIIEVRSDSGAQPANVDDAITGVKLSVHVLTDPAFAGGTDDNPGATAAGAAIGNDVILATGTADHYRASSSNDAAAPLLDIFDGSVGVGTFNLVVNTVAFVIGATAAITAWTMTVAET